MNASQLGSELARAVRNRRYEQTENGVLFPEAKLIAAGVFTAWVNDGPKDVSPNVVTNEGINSALGILFHAGAAPAAWYIVPFSGTGVPASTITAANFNGQLTEFTAYSESTRPQWVTAAASGTSITASAPAQFTISADSSNVYGAALTTISTKSATAGVMYAAAQFTAPKLAMGTGDVLYVTYSASFTSA